MKDIRRRASLTMEIAEEDRPSKRRSIHLARSSCGAPRAVKGIFSPWLLGLRRRASVPDAR